MDSLLIAIALAMDAFSVAITGGATLKKPQLKDSFLVGIYFGVFQGIMPIIGWQAGKCFEKLISSFDHWIAFAMLFFIGGKMVIEPFRKKEDETHFELTHKLLIILAIATSIDAMGVGLSYALLERPIMLASLIIGIVAFLFSFFGIYLGKCLKKIVKNKAELIGGIILLGIGVKILFDHGVFS